MQVYSVACKFIQMYKIAPGTDFLTWGVNIYRSQDESDRNSQEIQRLTVENTR